MPIKPITEHETLLDEYCRYARAFLQAHPCFFLPELNDEDGWLWHPQHERYETTPRCVQAEVYAWMVENLPTTVTKGRISAYLINAVLRILKDRRSLKNSEINLNPDQVLIPTTPDRVKWCIFDFTHKLCIPNTPDQFTLCCEDWAYLPDQTTVPPPYERLLALTHTPEDRLRRIQLHRAILTGAIRRYDRLVWFCGFPRTGKGATMALLSAMIGRGNYSNLSCRKMMDKFVGVSFVNKRANFSRDDVSAYLEDESVEFIKTMVSFADEQSMRQFFGPEKDFKNIAVMVFGSNFLPKLKSTYDHNSIIGKILVDIFDIKPETIDPNFVQELVDARDAIASYLINQPDGITQAFCNQLTPSGCGSIADTWRLWSDPIYRILRDVIHYDETPRIYAKNQINQYVDADIVVDYVQQKLVEIEQGNRKHEYLVQSVNEYVQSVRGVCKRIQSDRQTKWFYDKITCSVPGADPLFHRGTPRHVSSDVPVDVDALIQNFGEMPRHV